MTQGKVKRHTYVESIEMNKHMNNDVQPQPATILQHALANYDSCRDAGDEKGLARAEQHLAEIMPGCIFDIFALLPCLADKQLSETTREKIIANMNRSARFLQIEFNNVITWFQLRETGVAQCNASHHEAASHLTQAQERIASAQSILGAIAGDALAECAVTVMDQTASDLQASKALLDIAGMQINNPVLAEIKAKNEAERQTFEEVLSARRQ